MHKIITLLIIWSVFAPVAWGQETEMDGLTFTYSNGGSVSQNADGQIILAAPGDYTISGKWRGDVSEASGGNRKAAVAVSGNGEYNITMNGGTIDASSKKYVAAFSILSGAKVNLTLEGGNTLKSGYCCAGLQVPEGATLVITEGSGDNKLTAVGETNAAGIGGGYEATGGEITIDGGNILAEAGIDGAGIGGGRGGAGGKITINGGNIVAKVSLDWRGFTNDGTGIGGGSGGAGGEITIKGGVVEATGKKGAGIGGGEGRAGGEITIEGGKVTAIGLGSGSIDSGSGAGIGGGRGATGGTITIKGGEVTATGGTHAAGIGGGGGGSRSAGAGGVITISGGTVTATGHYGGAGIGGGYGRPGGSGGTITISGGFVMATGGDDYILGAGIGGGEYARDHGTFTTTDSGNAFIIANSIGDNADGKKADWSGVIFEGNDGLVYGSDITLPEGEITIPEGKTLTVEDGKQLTVNAGTTLKNNGTIVGEGTIAGTNALRKLSDNVLVENVPYSGQPVDPIVKYGDELLTLNTDYTLTYPAGTDRTDVTANPISVTITPKGGYWGSQITDKTFLIVKAEPKAADFNFEAPSGWVYGDVDKSVTVSTKGSISGMGDQTELKYYAENSADPLGAVPTDAGAYVVKITMAEGTSYTAVTDLTGDEKNPWRFEIAKKPVTVTPASDQIFFAGWTDNDVKYSFGQDDVISGDEENVSVTGFQVESGVFVKSGLSLTGTAADNYELKYWSDGVPVTVYETTADKVEATVSAGTLNENGWANQAITLNAPKGFVFVDGEDVSMAIPEDSREFSAEGFYFLKLKTATVSESSYRHRLPIDMTVPEVDVIVKDLSYEITASDALSGIASVKLDGNELTGSRSADYTGTATAGEHALVVTDKAGNKTEKKFTLTEPVDPPNPPDDPETPVEPPVKVYHTVTLPTVEGATTDPAAGSHEVESFDAFHFTLTLDDSYNQSVPIVTTSRGDRLEPRLSDGAYVITSVRSDIDIRIDGIVRNPDPVANETVTSPDIRIRTDNGCLYIQAPRSEKAYIFTLDGHLLKSFRITDSEERIPLPRGVYLLLIGDRRLKVVV